MQYELRKSLAQLEDKSENNFELLFSVPTVRQEIQKMKEAKEQ